VALGYKKAIHTKLSRAFGKDFTNQDGLSSLTASPNSEMGSSADARRQPEAIEVMAEIKPQFIAPMACPSDRSSGA
jgi:hypothetical protein